MGERGRSTALRTCECLTQEQSQPSRAERGQDGEPANSDSSFTLTGERDDLQVCIHLRLSGTLTASSEHVHPALPSSRAHNQHQGNTASNN